MSSDHTNLDACPPGESRRNVLRALYRPWLWLVFMPLLGLWTAFMSIAAMAWSFVSPRLGLLTGNAWGRGVCWMNFTRVEVRGTVHLAPGVSYVMVSNHQSHFDVPILMGHVWREFLWVMKKELRKVPIFGPACQRVGHIYIDRKNREQAVAALNAARPRLTGGRSVLFFPEGTRSADGRMREFKKGAFVMAMDLGLPILPISVSGTNAILPGRSFRLLPGKALVTLHPPVDPKAYGPEERDRLMEDVRNIIASGLTEWERSWKPDADSLSRTTA
jgi:1-acyl-sn-glycerol-3-phosphate acyltransferase